MAVKELRLPPTLSAQERAERVARAAREAPNAGRLRDHPNIVTVYDVAVENGIPWIVMQLVDGRSLDEQVKQRGPLPLADAMKVATALLRALDAADKAGIVHRDVKPANVMLTTAGDVLLTDFGIAVHRTDTALTATGAVIGSAEYLALSGPAAKARRPPAISSRSG